MRVKCKCCCIYESEAYCVIFSAGKNIITYGYSAAQRHPNIKTRSELVQLAHVNAFHYTCAFKRAQSLFMVSAFTTHSYCYSCYLSRSWKRWHSKTNAFETRSCSHVSELHCIFPGSQLLSVHLCSYSTVCIIVFMLTHRLFVCLIDCGFYRKRCTETSLSPCWCNTFSLNSEILLDTWEPAWVILVDINIVKCRLTRLAFLLS